MSFFSWLGVANNGRSLEIGDPTPDVVGQDEAGNSIRLADYSREGHTLIYFFPKADTPGCTEQACALRDEYGELTARRVRVLGVSADSAAKLRRFKAKHHLPFPLLMDEHQQLSQAFGVPTILGMTHRQSFLIKEGKLVWRDLRASTRWQARDVIQAIDKLGQRS